MCAAGALGTILILPSSALAQAWLPARGEGSVSLTYSQLFVEDHLFAAGDRQDVGQIRSHALMADVEYGVTDRWAIRAMLPYVYAKYVGGSPHEHGGQQPPGYVMLDRLQPYHSGVQDLRFEVRHGPMEFPVAIAPFVAVSLPASDYEYFAHSAIGLNMVEVQLGTYAGMLLGPFSFEGRVAYGIYERILGIRRNRSTIDVEIGWSAGRNVRLFVFEASQISHGGFDIPFEDLKDLKETASWWPNHDQLARANFLNLGTGASVRITHSMSLHASMLTTMTGVNTHAAKYGFSMGASWGFGGPRPLHPSPTQTP